MVWGGEGSVGYECGRKQAVGEGKSIGVCEDGRECCGMEEVHVSRAYMWEGRNVYEVWED